MKILPSFITVFILVLFVSCNARLYYYPEEHVSSINPQIDQLAETELGESLIDKEVGIKYPAMVLKQAITSTSRALGKTIEFKKGETLILKTYSKKYLLFAKEKERAGIAISKSDHKSYLYVDPYGDGRITINRQIDSSFYTMTKVPIPGKDYLKKEFVYNGKIGTGVKFLYREFIDDMARPAFSQDLQYDLSEGRIIGFRGLRIEVINAQNTKIEYKVLSYFNN